MKIVSFETPAGLHLGVVAGDQVVDLQAADPKVPSDLGSQRDNIPKFPTIFMRCLTSMVPHERPIIRPRASETLDYEAELMLIVGRAAKHLTMDNATSCIAGYACSNEGSVREFQRKTTQWDMGKNFDRTGGFGPWMVTADELFDAGKGL